MATSAQKAGLGIAGVFAACALAAPALVSNEGWRLKTYTDPVRINTVCAGVTGPNVIASKTYSELDCQALTAEAALKIANAIRPCEPEGLSVETQAAFIRFSYNAGPHAFCSSSISRKARSGDLAGACAGLSAWVFAGGRKLPGLVTRRAEERAQCERGLR